jgi:hypothetical protein
MLKTSAITTCGGPVRTRRSICARQLTRVGLVLSLLLVGCAVVFVSSYDEVTDQQIQDAAKKTEALIGDVLANRASYNQHAKDYQEIDGTLGALEMRAANYQNNEAEIKLIQDLRAAMRNLQRIHKEIGPFRQAEAEGVRSLFRSLIHLELSKKRSASINKTMQ